MKKRILLTLAACAVLQTAAWGALCTQGTLQSYINLGTGGCTIGDKVFSGFSLIPSGTNSPSSTVITVSPVILANGDIGLSFNDGWFASSNTFSDSTIGFNVAVIGGGAFLIE